MELDRSRAGGGQHAAAPAAAAAVGAPARGDVEPLDPHGGRERRRAKTALAATAAAAAGAGAGIRRRRRRPVHVAAGADQVVEEAELQRRVRRGVALAQQEAGVVHQRVARARRRRPAAERRPAAPTLLAALREKNVFVTCQRGRAWRQDCFLGSRHKGGGGYLVEQEGRRAEDEVGAAGVDVDQLLLGPARPRRAEHRLGLPAAAAAAARGGLDGQPAHGPGRHPPRAGSRPRLWLPERERVETRGGRGRLGLGLGLRLFVRREGLVRRRRC
jgi:hypothetical protein